MTQTKPIRIFYGHITGTFYATQHYTETIENGIRNFKCTGRKYNVTQDIANIITHEQIEFVPDKETATMNTQYSVKHSDNAETLHSTHATQEAARQTAQQEADTSGQKMYVSWLSDHGTTCQPITPKELTR